MYRLLALDMDGTLLNPHKMISPRVFHSIQAIIGKGVNVTIASGRFPASVWLHGMHVGMNSPLVAFNGAVILDPNTGEKLHGYPLSSDSARRIAALGQMMGTYVHFYGYSELFVEQLNEWNVKWPLANVVIDPEKAHTYENYKDQASRIQMKQVGSMVKFTEAASEQLYKATFISEDSQLLNEVFNELQSWNEFTLTRTGSRRFDVNAAGISKRSALEVVTRRLGISSDQVAAVGDYDNDVDMLQWAGLGISMDNGSDEAKKAANAVTASNSNDGVADVIERYF
ncbi:HAD family phosphatase [Paenibacillus sp. SYP-B3998]|uniref:HAD family phosphatase n=1 Tax=Paenibacillus sp. SYP-B3998 TaxID=2678564 RepID=A0A6G4A565_9BACL|nr:Cof-type HAD-IIB family hydrolase [Paenibacillus sp. SYP-B3998]NEW08949.1 HAD family phosphatase [Paenibacillus sp. SYP-B3998]